jgi:hypothetical protein
MMAVVVKTLVSIIAPIIAHGPVHGHRLAETNTATATILTVMNGAIRDVTLAVVPVRAHLLVIAVEAIHQHAITPAIDLLPQEKIAKRSRSNRTLWALSLGVRVRTYVALSRTLAQGYNSLPDQIRLDRIVNAESPEAHVPASMPRRKFTASLRPIDRHKEVNRPEEIAGPAQRKPNLATSQLFAKARTVPRLWYLTKLWV